ncbi:hypothetical protein ACWDRB_64845 [Nonomuraea sp. NPDC003707]
MSDQDFEPTESAPESPEPGSRTAAPEGAHPSAEGDIPGTPGGAGPHALPRPATDPAPHGRCLHDGKPLPLSRGRKPRKFCDDRCKNAYYRHKERTERETLTAAVATTEAVLTEARPLADLMLELAERYEAGTEQIEQGALQRIATAEIKAAEAEADALAARDKAEAAEQARRSAERSEREARAAQRQAEEREDRARADLERVQRETGERVAAAERRAAAAEAKLEHSEEVRTSQAGELRRLRADLAQAAARIDELTVALEARKEELAHAHGENRRLTDRADQADQRLAVATERLQETTAAATEARAETRAVRGELTAERRRFDDERERLRGQAEQARRAQAEADTAAAAAVAALQTRLQVTTEDLQATRGQLATAQTASGLVLPEPIDLSRDLGDGVWGVVLPESGIESVTRHPDGAVVLYHQNTQIRLGEPAHAPAQARALAAALLALRAGTT